MSSRGVPGAAELPPASATPTASRVPTAQQLRTSYHNRLESAINSATEAFKEIVSSCVIRDRASNARADFQAQVEAGNLAKAADELLRLISELKIAAIVQDVRESKVECSEMRHFYDEIIKSALHEISGLKDGVAGALAGLEKHYYDSCTRWETSEAAAVAAEDPEEPMRQ